MCMAALARRETCANRREGSASNPVYCADHELCDERGCNEFRAFRGRGVRLDKCEERELLPGCSCCCIPCFPFLLTPYHPSLRSRSRFVYGLPSCPVCIPMHPVL
ncbi:hypothetical protein GGR54DRAFT_21999 [Hypoxylon sp. NC1633]|nr:hypothetical protein GGR54DRAFT_21999 [Hypoxylon sp. NC1633]